MLIWFLSITSDALKTSKCVTPDKWHWQYFKAKNSFCFEFLTKAVNLVNSNHVFQTLSILCPGNIYSIWNFCWWSVDNARQLVSIFFYIYSKCKVLIMFAVTEFELYSLLIYKYWIIVILYKSEHSYIFFHSLAFTFKETLLFISEPANMIYYWHWIELKVKLNQYIDIHPAFSEFVILT